MFHPTLPHRTHPARRCSRNRWSPAATAVIQANRKARRTRILLLTLGPAIIIAVSLVLWNY